VPWANTACHYNLIRRNGGRWEVRSEHGTIASGATSDDSIAAMVADINRRAIDSFGGFAIHAGVVATGDSAVAFPAESGIGKSTLAAACLRTGFFTYVSDEALCIDPTDGQVLCYPKPIALSPWSLAAIGIPCSSNSVASADEILHTPDSLGAGIAEEPLQLAHIVLPVRNRRPSRLLPLSCSDGFAALLRFSFNHYKDPRRAFELSCQLAGRASTWRLEFDCPVRAAQLLRVELGG
jgi:hypothetical protein